MYESKSLSNQDKFKINVNFSTPHKKFALNAPQLEETFNKGLITLN